MSAKLNAFDTHFVGGGGSDILFLVNRMGELSEIPLNKTKNLKKSQKKRQNFNGGNGEGFMWAFWLFIWFFITLSFRKKAKYPKITFCNLSYVFAYLD